MKRSKISNNQHALYRQHTVALNTYTSLRFVNYISYKSLLKHIVPRASEEYWFYKYKPRSSFYQEQFIVNHYGSLFCFFFVFFFYSLR